jgi:hypothetical protein
MPTKRQARSQDSAKLDPTAEPTTLPPADPSHEKFLEEQDALQRPGRASKSDADFIDNEPGYSKDQLDHMREYYGTKESTATVADV